MLLLSFNVRHFVRLQVARLRSHIRQQHTTSDAINDGTNELPVHEEEDFVSTLRQFKLITITPCALCTILYTEEYMHMHNLYHLYTFKFYRNSYRSEHH